MREIIFNAGGLDNGGDNRCESGGCEGGNDRT